MAKWTNPFLLTPSRVRHWILSVLQALTGRVSRILGTPLGLWLTPLFIIALYLGFYFFVTLNPWVNDANESFFEIRYFWIIPVVVPAVLILEMLSRLLRRGPLLALLLASGLLWVLIPEMLAYAKPDFIPSVIRTTFIFTLSLDLLVFRATRGLGYSARFLIFFAVGLMMVFVLDSMDLYGLFGQSFWITQPYRLVFLFSMLAAEEALRRESVSWNDLRFVSFLLNPTNWISPLPIRFEDWKVDQDDSKARDALKAKATIYLVISFFMLSACAYLQENRQILLELGWLPRWFRFGLVNYLYFFTFSYANITIPVALAWWFGFKLPDAYDLPLLATTPQDRWRRWNTYFYEWYFRSVFFPVFKVSRSLFAAVFMSFLATLLIHLGSVNGELIYSSVNEESLSRQFYKKTLFFLAHALLVYLGMKAEKYLPRDDERKGWVSVLIMFLLMSWIHSVFSL